MGNELPGQPPAATIPYRLGAADDIISGDAAPLVVLEGCMVLVAEHGSARALDLAEILRNLGCEVLGPAGSGTEALELLAHQRPNVALLDAGPGCDGLVPLARALAAAAVPFALVTGGPADGPPDHPALRAAPRLARSSHLPDLCRVLRALYRSNLERRLALDEQQIASGRERLAYQIRAIERLAAQGGDTFLAERLLRGIGRSLRLMRAHRAYLLRRLALDETSRCDGRITGG
jgi:DNA-binding NarL/FixJ family response regulator